MKCLVCNKNVGGNDVRMGVCWDCAEAEEIIANGVDMYDKGPDGDVKKPASTSMDKLRFLIKKGWKH